MNYFEHKMICLSDHMFTQQGIKPLTPLTHVFLRTPLVAVSNKAVNQW